MATDDWPHPSWQAFRHLVIGRDYRVVQAFRDFDGQAHDVGEAWTFHGHSFLPYDDGLSLFVVQDGRQRQIRMRWADEDQGPIVDALHAYIQPLT
ncbi:MAG: DUF3601 domain-containing protein [Rhizobiaceae bacterium]